MQRPCVAILKSGTGASMWSWNRSLCSPGRSVSVLHEHLQPDRAGSGVVSGVGTRRLQHQLHDSGASVVSALRIPRYQVPGGWVPRGD